MAETETDDLVRSGHPTPHMARRCRIPKLNRSSSTRSSGRHADYHKDSRPISLTLPSKAKDFSWRYMNHGVSMSSMGFPSMDDDKSSLKSFGSFVSYASLASQSQATDASLSRPNSRVRGKKYVLHCERRIGPTEEYLTPTQRKDKEIRQLKQTLMRATRQCEEKDAEIGRLKSEIERLHDALAEVGKARSMNSSQGSDTLEGIITKNSASENSVHSQESENFNNVLHVQNDDSGISNDLSISPRNSSELDENDSPAQKDSPSNKESSTDPTLLDSSSDSLVKIPAITEKSSKRSKSRDASTQESLADSTTERISQELEGFLSTYQKELNLMKTQHKEHYHDLKAKFDERVQDLQLKLTEANSRYLELRPLFEKAQDKIINLETQLGEVQRDMENQEEWHNQMYLKMYRKGQEAARFESAEEVSDYVQRNSKRVTVPDLLRQLQQLEAELDETKHLYREALRGMGDRQAEYTLRFLKDAVFYFLTKKDKEHLKAIQSILGFSEAERMAVAKAMKHRRL